MDSTFGNLLIIKGKKMDLYVRNIDPELMTIVRLNLNDLHKRGIKISQSEY